MKFTLKGAIKKIKKTIGITTSKPKAKRSRTSSAKKSTKKDSAVEVVEEPVTVEVVPNPVEEVKRENTPEPVNMPEEKETKATVSSESSYTSEQLALIDKMNATENTNELSELYTVAKKQDLINLYKERMTVLHEEQANEEARKKAEQAAEIARKEEERAAEIARKKEEEEREMARVKEEQEKAAALKKEQEDERKFIELFPNAETLAYLKQIATYATKKGLEVPLIKRMTPMLKEFIPKCDSIDELADYEDFAEKCGLEEPFIIRMTPMLKEFIPKCDSFEDLAEYEDIAEKCGMKDEFDKRYDELGGDFDDKLEQAKTIDDYLALLGKAQKNDAEDVLIDAMSELDLEDVIKAASDSSITEEQKEILYKVINEIVEYKASNEELYMLPGEVVAIKDILDPDVFDSAMENALIDYYRDMGLDSDFFEYYDMCSSDYFDDWISDYVEKEYNNGYYDELVELAETYGESIIYNKVFTLGDLYYNYARQLEANRQVSEAVKYYNKAAAEDDEEDYGAAAAKERLEELYK